MSSAKGARAAGTPQPRGRSAEPLAFAFDELDKRIIACLRADGRASWTDIARRCGSSVATVSRRGQRLLANNTVQVAVVPTTTHPGRSSMFFLRMACRSGTQAHVAEALAGHPDIRFLALVAGRYDIAAEVCVDTGKSVTGQLMSDILEIDGVEWCETDLIMHEYKVAQDWTWQLLVGETGAVTVAERHTCVDSHLDEADQHIVEVMRADGRAGFSVVAGQVGMDETTVRRRFEAMLSCGCITVVTLAPASALGFTSEVLLDISVDPRKLREVSRRLTEFAGVRFVAATLSSSSLLCEMIQPSEDALFGFLTETLATLDGVHGWQASMELLTVRRGFVETPWWRRELEGHLDAPPVALSQAVSRPPRARVARSLPGSARTR
jgi:DNA-binding Lrp family transcriptional regulator